jgi:hypothetical protein
MFPMADWFQCFEAGPRTPRAFSAAAITLAPWPASAMAKISRMIFTSASSPGS